MHTIRLRGPWHVEPSIRFASPLSERQIDLEVPEPQRQVMPADWSASLGKNYFGTVRYRRSFGQPTNLKPDDWVWLVVEPPRSSGSIHLNGRFLGAVRFGEPAGRFEILSLLEERNELVIYVSHPQLDAGGKPPDDDSLEFAGGLVGEVRLEITEGRVPGERWHGD